MHIQVTFSNIISMKGIVILAGFIIFPTCSINCGCYLFIVLRVVVQSDVQNSIAQTKTNITNALPPSGIKNVVNRSGNVVFANFIKTEK